MKNRSRRLTSRFFKNKRLTIEEEQELAEKIHSDDQDEANEAFETLVLSNIRLAITIAKEFMNRGVEFDDLVSEGIIGLMNGAKHFLPSKGAKFSTYAVYWIKNRIQRFLPHGKRAISIPRRSAILRTQFMKFKKEHENDMDLREMAKATNHWLTSLRQMKESLKIVPLRQDDYGNFGSYVEKEFSKDEDKLLDFLMNSNELSEMEKIILTYRFGLNGEEPSSLEKLSFFFGRSKERIRQVEKRALRKLKEQLK